MKTVQINNIETFDLFLYDENKNPIDIDGYANFYKPKAIIYIENEYLIEPTVNRVDKGHYKITVELFDDYFDLSNQYKIVWHYTIKGKDYTKIDTFEIVDNIDTNFDDFKKDRMSYLMSEIRELVCDASIPIPAFTITRQNSNNSIIKLRNKIFYGFNNDKPEFQLDLNEFDTLNDLLFEIDDNYNEWIITVEENIDRKRNPMDLQEILKTAAGSGVQIYFEHFFEDKRIKNIILENLVQFNKDFNLQFSIDNFLPQYLFAFKYLIASSITRVRSSIDAKTFSLYYEEGRIQHLMLGGKLEIDYAQDGTNAIKKGVTSWLDLSKYYYDLYEKELNKIIKPLPIIEMGTR